MQKAKRAEEGIKRIKISDIIVGQRIRTNFADMDSFALSLSIEGMHQPILVDIAAGGKYTLVEGERRIRASKMNGETMIDAIIFETLSEARRKEIELIHLVQRQNIPVVEEALATRSIIEAKRKERQGGGFAKFGSTLSQKEVATELSMSESRMSENLRIADAVDEFPELETTKLSRKALLREIRSGRLNVRDGGMLHQRYKESYIVSTPQGCLETVNGNILDLVILHPDKVEAEFLSEVISRLSPFGQVVIFCDYQSFGEWSNIASNNGLNVCDRPYIWHIKGSDDYQNFLWCGKNIMQPIRPLTNMLSAAKDTKSLHPKAKPLGLMLDIVKCCSERGNFVMIPDCTDINSVRACVETERNVRAATSNKILRDRLIISISQDN